MKRKTVAELIAELQAYPPGDTVVIASSVGDYEVPKAVRLGMDVKERGLLGRTLYRTTDTVVLAWGNWGYDSVSDY